MRRAHAAAASAARSATRCAGGLRGIILCHCGQCRRWHGYLGAYTSAARADVMLEGAEAVRWFATSARGRRGFCATCGSSLFFEHAGEARLGIAAGSLEYVADKADYVRIDDGLPALAGDFGAEGQRGA
jgi:hypothetical protein